VNNFFDFGNTLAQTPALAAATLAALIAVLVRIDTARADDGRRVRGDRNKAGQDAVQALRRLTEARQSDEPDADKIKELRVAALAALDAYRVVAGEKATRELDLASQPADTEATAAREERALDAESAGQSGDRIDVAVVTTLPPVNSLPSVPALLAIVRDDAKMPWVGYLHR
jgi:hypothetical protein